MGKCCGKCSFEDTVEIHGLDNIIKSNIYVGQDIVPIKVESEKDLVPFYAHLIRMSFSEKGIGSFYLTSESFVDMEERDRLEWYQEEIIKYIKKCKRKKIEPKFDEMPRFMKGFNDKQQEEIFNRVLNKSMSLDGIHLDMSDYYRKNLYDEMLRVGWEEDKAYKWCFGWTRWFAKLKKDGDDNGLD